MSSNRKIIETFDSQWLMPETLETIAEGLANCSSSEMLDLFRSTIPRAVLRHASRILAIRNPAAKVRILDWLNHQTPDEDPMFVQGWDRSAFIKTGKDALKKGSTVRSPGRQSLLPSAPFPKVGDRIYRQACTKYPRQRCRVISTSYSGVFAESETGVIWHISYYAWKTRCFVAIDPI